MCQFSKKLINFQSESEKKMGSLYWPDFVLGPGWVERPDVEHGGGFYVIFRNERDLEKIWQLIIGLTVNGDLGHYSAISPNREVICVHHSNVNNQNERFRIYEILELHDLTDGIKYKSQVEANSQNLL